MADKTTTTRTAEFQLTLTRGNEIAERSISFEMTNTSTPFNLKDVAASLAGDYKYIVQPTGWRDSDTTEEAWQVSQVKPLYISKSVTTLNSGTWSE